MKYKLTKKPLDVIPISAKFKLKKKESTNNKFNLKLNLEKEIVGNIWDYIGKANIICIPTNNFISTNGRNAMGAGLAKEFSTKYPEMMEDLGSALKVFGPRPYIIKNINGTKISSFPVKPDYTICNKDKSNIVKHARRLYKPGDKVPGFHAIANLDIIKKSAWSLRLVSDIWFKAGLLKRVILPKPGCGLGELDWKDVKRVLKEDGIYDRPYLQIISRN